jgi:hypothetical protein
LEFLRNNLGDYKQREQSEKEDGPREIAPIQCHRDRVAAGLSKRSRRNLDDPKDERYLGHLSGSTRDKIRVVLLRHATAMPALITS